MTDHTSARPVPWTTRRRFILVLAIVVLAVLTATMLWRADRARRAEVNRLADLLSLRQGMTVSEIGAGTGWLTVEVAHRVGPSGRVYSTELSVARLEALSSSPCLNGTTADETR